MKTYCTHSLVVPVPKLRKRLVEATVERSSAAISSNAHSEASHFKGKGASKYCRKKDDVSPEYGASERSVGASVQRYGKLACRDRWRSDAISC